MKTQKLTIQEIEYVAYSMAKKFMEWDEPIPSFGSRFPNLLESCIQQPFVVVGGEHAYRGLIGKATILFYLMIKNHPFENGNKRIAITTLLFFLSKHDKWLEISNQAMYIFAKEVAESGPKEKDKTVTKIQKILEAFIVPYHTEKNSNE